MTLREKLQKLLIPYKQNQVARLSGVSAMSIRNILDGKTKSPSLSTLTAIASVLGVKVGFLADDSAEWPPERVAPITDRAA